MFDFVHRKKTIVQIILFLVMLPFLFWGIQSYRNESQMSAVATIEGEEIPRWEFDQALRNQHERLRNMLKDNFNSAMLDNPEMRLAVLEGLIQQKIMHREAEDIGLTVLDSRLASEIQSISAFHDENGKFSYQRYEELLRRQQMTPVIFEGRVGAEILQQQLLEPLSKSAMVADTMVQTVIRLSEVKRVIDQVEIAPDQYLSEVNPDEEAIKAYYDQYQAEFLLPERVRIEYLVLSLNDLAQQEAVSSEEVRNYYEEHQSDYGQPEERQASHILIAVTDSSEDEKAEAKRKAEDILTQVTEDPEKFADLAKEFSDDSGSAKSGGELGFLGKGVLVKEFEDALFQMEPNEIRGPVETAFGFHIIKLSEIKPAKVATVEEVEDSIEETLKRQKITSRFGEIAEEFSNIVYEQSDSLLPAADRFNLTVKQPNDWINKRSREPLEIASEKLMQALFSDDVIKEGRNTEAIEVMPDTFVSARVLEHKSAAAQSLEVVRDQIIQKLKLQLAAEKTGKEGNDKLARLIAGETDVVDWGDTPKTVSYMQSQGLDIETMRAIFKADVSQLPVYVGVTSLQGKYNLVRINQVIEPDIADQAKLQSFGGQLKQMLLQEELAAYQASLRQRYSVKIQPESY